MITTELKFRVHKAGNGYQGKIVIPARLSKYFEWKEQLVYGMFFSENEVIDMKEIIRSAEQLNDEKKIKVQIEKLKEKFGLGGKENEKIL